MYDVLVDIFFDFWFVVFTVWTRGRMVDKFDMDMSDFVFVDRIV